MEVEFERLFVSKEPVGEIDRRFSPVSTGAVQDTATGGKVSADRFLGEHVQTRPHGGDHG
jgi:hypothetical protein